MQGKELAICRGHEGTVNSVCVTDDGKIVSGSWDKTVRVWICRAKNLRYAAAMNIGLFSVCVMNDGKIVSGSDDKTVRVWDMQGKTLAICRGHGDGIFSVCVTGDGKIVSGSC